MQHGALHDRVNFINFIFWIKYQLNVGINFIVLLFYRVIHVFLV